MTMQKRGGVPAQRMLAAAGFVLTGLVAAGPAWCESGLHGFNRSLDDDYSLAVGAYLADVNSRYQTVTRSGIASAYIDMERLGLAENETQPFLSAKARLNDRWRIDLHAFGTDRSGTRTADHDIDLGEAGTIPINARVDTTFRAAIYAIRAGYSFVRTQRSELGAGFGLHVATLDVGVRGQIGVGGPTPPVAQDHADVLAPLPTLAVYGTYAFTPTLSVEGYLSWLSLSYDKYQGSLLDTFVGLEYRPFDHIGFGLGYNVLDFNLDVEESRRVDTFDVRFGGPVAYLKMGF